MAEFPKFYNRKLYIKRYQYYWLLEDYFEIAQVIRLIISLCYFTGFEKSSILWISIREGMKSFMKVKIKQVSQETND